MLHLIVRLVPRALHRTALKLAHRTRHYWRQIVKPRLAGVSVIAVDGAGQVLLVRHSYGPDTWALPGGGCSRGEDPLDTARREIAEELGRHLLDARCIDRLEETLSGAPHTAWVIAGQLDGPPRPDRREVVAAQYFPASDLPGDLSPVAARRIAAWRALEQA